ncbi:MAG: hypothetical protein AAF962_13730 [Actinomycetota bacterium]
MSAITYPAAGRRRRLPSAPDPARLQRWIHTVRLRNWDDRPGVERNASPSEVALRSISGLPTFDR